VQSQACLSYAEREYFGRSQFDSYLGFKRSVFNLKEQSGLSAPHAFFRYFPELADHFAALAGKNNKKRVFL